MSAGEDDYPISGVVTRSRAAVKPDPRVICQRCPNATWITELKFADPGKSGGKVASDLVDYGLDQILRAECAAIHAKWIWPQHNVVDCDARRRAIGAERSSEGN